MSDGPLYLRKFPTNLRLLMAQEVEISKLTGGPFRGQREVVVAALEDRYRDILEAPARRAAKILKDAAERRQNP